MLIAGCSASPGERSRLCEAVRRFADGEGAAVTYVGYEGADALLGVAKGGIGVPELVLVDADSLGDGFGSDLRGAGFEGVLVFVSADESHALPAFDARAFNYALKGDGSEARFRRVMRDACELARRRSRRLIVLNGVSRHESVPIDSIDLFDVDRHVCTARFDDGREPFEFVSSLSAIEDRLAPYGFVRCHRGRVLNARKVASLRAREATLLDGVVVPIGRSYAGSVRDVYGRVLGLRGEGGGVIALGSSG